jgi:hypothetical protein
MRIVAASLFCLLAFSARAAEDSAHAAAATRLAEITITGFQPENTTCVSDRAVFGAELKRNFQARASSYGGISPQSQYWPEIEELNYQYRIATCPSLKEIVQKVADLLGRELTTADLDASATFFASPVGQRLLAGVVKAGKASDRTPSPQKAAADLAYQSGLRELMAKYKREPK